MADLTTMVLQTEPIFENINDSPIEHFTKDIVKLLLQYVHDSDIKVVQAISTTLKNVMESKEAKNIAGL